MSQSDIYRRIAAAMPSDEEVQALCRKYIERADKSSANRTAKMDAVRRALGQVMGTTETESQGVSAKEVAAWMNENGYATQLCDKGQWSPQGAGYYLRALVKEGTVTEIDGSPKTYVLAE